MSVVQVYSRPGVSRDIQPPPPARSTPPLRESIFASIDRSVGAWFAQLTGGLAPAALAGAYLDWAAHLAVSPGKRLKLLGQALDRLIADMAFGSQAILGIPCDPCGEALDQDRRFRDRSWQAFPFNVAAHAFLSIERWWDSATTGVRGVNKNHENMVAFTARQILDTMAPTNFLCSNPQVIERTRAELGANLIRGVGHWFEDFWRAQGGLPPAGCEHFKVGETVAITPGKVVHRTRLAEIIQYAPAGDQVRPEPIVIVPAWIMKYYILDLSPKNSLVRYLTDQGFTVFMISWKNPGSEDRDTAFDDYRTEGVLPAIQAAAAITGCSGVHAVGYCLGGTLLAIVAAAMARDRDERLRSVTLLAAETDFTDAGELGLFINESQVAFLEDLMWQRGYLDAAQMAGAFQMLRSNDLIWSRMVHDYLMGDRSPQNDIMAWNADATRMPYRMHSEYLRSLFLDDDLAEGRFRVAGRPVVLHDIRAPMFVVATEQDHVAPWRSVFKLNLLTETELTFALTNGGHNAGILSEPGHSGRRFRAETRAADAPYIDPDAWMAANAPRQGSWWPAWTQWLAQRSGPMTRPPTMGKPGTAFAALGDAPGRYVRMK
jgi:poly[(R)-3-hydroxyalkanoate] polymerase subunit PhaC